MTSSPPHPARNVPWYFCVPRLIDMDTVLPEMFGLSVTHGKHAMEFGGGYNRYIKNQQLFGNTNGYFNFNDNWSNGAPTTAGLTATRISTS